ncbi:MAG: hypothetical protein A3G34_00235 [Candidatus Lindowbacteria bacterium RIFCSPLOWO2_12_FULL_62_27]|nr:MAG: hypothetical protein A3G34_00235 [Candidatus Lindowbacteria bacterium RIFCSPLOWO2_12_FULL_62_27]
MEQAIRRPMDLTYEDYLLTPEDQRYELIEGDLEMTPSPRTLHQIVCSNVFRLLDPYVQERRLGRVLFGPTDVILSNINVLVPDILFVAQEREAVIEDRGIVGPPDLVVEVISPSSGEKDRVIKRRVYYKYGVREYWIVDPFAKTAEVCVVGKSAFDTHKIFTPGEKLKSPLLPDFSPDTSDFFKR